MFKKAIVFHLLMVSFLYAIQVGDKLDNKLSKSLHIKNDWKVYVVDFFASWCKSCVIELPLIEKLHKSFDKSQYKIVGVNIDEDKYLGKNFVEDLALTFDVIYDNQNEIVAKFNPIGVPALYYIKNNKVQKVLFGAVHDIDKKIMTDIKTIKE
jgi:thiol-disulfide isomerase/thioredoxin